MPNHRPRWGEMTDQRLREFRKRAMQASEGRWGAFGMMLLTGEPGMNADTATHLADFYTRNEQDQPRTFDLDHVVNMQPMNAIALIDEVLRLREARHDLADALRLTREYVGEETLPAVPGWSWYDAMENHAPAMLGAMLAPRVAAGEVIGEVGPGNGRACIGMGGTYAQQDDGSWAEAEPLGMIGWKAKLEERFREYGWTRLANMMARWDERGLG